MGVNRIDTDCAHHDCDCDEFHRLSVRQHRSPLGGIGELLHVGSWRRLPASIKKHRSVCRTDSPCLGLCRTHARSIGQSGQIGSRVYRALFFLPVASTLVAMAIVWKYLLHDAIGPINLFLRWLGFAGIPFFSSPEWSMFSLAIIGVWQLAGFNMVLFLAGLTTIPSEIQDAATLDGADSFWRRLFTVTLPLLSPAMLFVVTTSSITAFKLFDAVAVLTKGGPQGATDVLLYATYREGFENLNTAGAAAMTVVFLVIIVAASWIQARISEKRVYYK